MSPEPKQHDSSFRDPSGFIFHYQNELFRQINQSYKDIYAILTSCGIYQKLVEDGKLITHDEIRQNLTGKEEWFLTLKPEFISFITYPYEWSFTMLKDAALLTLDICIEALSYGLILKDATPYNIQWRAGSPVLIDTLSFDRYDPQMPWIAYRQFTESFLAPLVLSHYLSEPAQKLLLTYPEGIPVRLASKLLPFRSRLNLNIFLHIHLQGKFSVQKERKQRETSTFSEKKLRNILTSLRNSILSLQYDTPSGVWSGYYEEAGKRSDDINLNSASKTGNYLALKKEIIQQWLHSHSFTTGIDVGGNEGVFTKLCAEAGIEMIAADSDHFSVNRLYLECKNSKAQNILPLLIDFTNPSPGLGMNNKERPEFLKRIRTDLVLALAVIHHFCIEKNITMAQVFSLLRELGKFLIVEFVPFEDEKIQLMLQRKLVTHPYSETLFTKAYEEHFILIDRKSIGQSGRTLYFLKNHE